MKKTGLLLNSGLGNQLFMIFALLSYCIDKASDYIIFYDSKKTKNYWDTMLDSFKGKCVDKDAETVDGLVYEEPHFHYSEIPAFDNDITLKGYFQSDKYFKHNLQEIKNVLGFKEKQQQVVIEHAKYFQRKTIALHFRIGDYMGLQAYHCIKRPDYYIKAFGTIADKLANDNENISDYDILYFCQITDNHIVDQYLSILQNHFGNTKLRFVKITDDIPDWKQMLLMTLCRHFIIANSTFSWFGAYLSDTYAEKKALVCYPQIWFGPLYKNHITSDLCPEDWISIAA
jgi:hypothetical protein